MPKSDFFIRLLQISTVTYICLKSTGNKRAECMNRNWYLRVYPHSRVNKIFMKRICRWQSLKNVQASYNVSEGDMSVPKPFECRHIGYKSVSKSS